MMTPRWVSGEPMPAPERLAAFLADIPDGALITTDPETAGVVQSVVDATMRDLAVNVMPGGRLGTVHADWPLGEAEVYLWHGVI